MNAVLKKDFDIVGGGAERYAANACYGLAERGHKLIVFAETFNGTQNENLIFSKVPRKSCIAFSRTVSFHKEVQASFNQSDFDLSWALSRTFPCDIFRVAETIQAKWLELRYPYWQRFNPRHSGILSLEKSIFNPNNVPAIQTNARLTRDQIVQYYNYPTEEIRVIRNGVHRHIFYPLLPTETKVQMRTDLGLPQDRFILVFAAGNFRAKGLEHGIRAFAKLDKEILGRATYVVLGWDDPEPYRQIATSLNLSSEQIRFEGKKENMRDYYCAADLMLYPTIYEPCSNACLEALSCGLPVLTTKLNGASELVSHGENGLLVSTCDDYNRIAELVTEFYHLSSETKKEWSVTALRASQDCDWANHINELEKFFTEVVERKRG